MKLLVKNHFENAFESLRSNKFRTYLSVVGITVGVGAVTIILSLLSGAHRLFGEQSVKVSDTTALIRSGAETRPESLLSFGSAQMTGAVNTLTERDSNDIVKKADGYAAPLAVFQSTVAKSDEKTKLHDISVIGSTGDLAKTIGLKMYAGQFIDEASGAVIGKQLSVDLFGTEDSLGSILKIRGETLTVVGVVNQPATPPSYLGVDFSRALILPLGLGKKFTQNTAQIQQIILTAENGQVLKTRLDEARAILDRNHHGDRDYHITVGSAITAPNSHLMSTLSLAVAVIAGISLLVGGVGITNIMLASIAERQREIGIRKAVGATNANIVGQFLIESACIGLLGGILGYLLGIGASLLLGTYLPFKPVIEWQSAVLAIGGALVIGMFFGIYPATRAANRDPIEILHH